MDRRECRARAGSTTRAAVLEVDDQQVVGGRSSAMRVAGAAATISVGVVRLGRRRGADQRATAAEKQQHGACIRHLSSREPAGLAEDCAALARRRAMYLATLMLLGSGELGREFAIAAKRLGCRVIACDRYADAPGDAGRRRARSLLDARRRGAARGGREAPARRYRPRDRGDRHRDAGRARAAKAGTSCRRPRRCS